MFVKIIVSIFLLAVVLGCQQSVKQQSNSQVIQYVHKSPIVALVGETPIRRNDLWNELVEYGGNLVVREHVLSEAIEQELRNKRLEVNESDVDHELRILTQTMRSENADAINEVFESNGIGPIRKSTLLWRNAALRKLVSKDVALQIGAVRRMFELVHGTRFPTSIIVTSTREQAVSCLDLLKSGIPFQTIAIEHSIDSSAERGGVVNPISLVDSAWPAPIREQLSNIQVGSVSDPIYIGDRWILVKATGNPIASDVKFEHVQPEMKRLATQTQERLLMDALELQLIDSLKLTIFDETLKNSPTF